MREKYNSSGVRRKEIKNTEGLGKLFIRLPLPSDPDLVTGDWDILTYY